jgi:hypothetical protein
MATADGISVKDPSALMKGELSASELVKGTAQYLMNDGGGVVADIFNDKKKGHKEVWNQPFISSDLTNHSIEGGAAHPHSADTVVPVLADHVPATLLGQLLQIAELSFRMLVEGADPQIKRSAFHFACSSSTRIWRSRTVKNIQHGWGLLSCCWNSRS